MARRIFRRARRKAPGSNTHANPGAFFDTTADHAFFAPQAAATVQRACAECEKEKKGDKVQRQAQGGAHSGAPSVSSYVSALSGKGTPLSHQSQSFFGPRFKASFSNVMVHNNAESAEAASAIGAKAFTYKNHIVFNEGQYNDSSTAGKYLLAHELTHVMQQDKGIKRKEVEHAEEEKLQRAPHSDFVIREFYQDAASVPNTIYFNFGRADIVASERAKLPALATPPGRALTLTGMVSEEGDPAFNTALLNQRIGNVGNSLGGLGHTAPRTPNPQPGASVGNMDYPKQRAVEVIATPAVVPPTGVPPNTVPSCSGSNVVSCGSTFTGPHGVAQGWVTAAKAALHATTPAAVAEVSALFPGKTVADVSPHIDSLATQMALLPAHHECHNECDAGCNRPAYKAGSSGAGATIVLCPEYRSASASFQQYLLIHEALHATPGLTTQDVAYAFTRLIQLLSGGDAMNNTDSYALLVMRLAGAATAGFSPPTDTATGLTGADLIMVRETVAFMEQWLDKSEFDTSLFYEDLKSNIGRVGGWDPAQAWSADLIHQISSFFGLTDPGAAPHATSPIEADKWIMAGMHHRYTRLKNGVYGVPLSYQRAASGNGTWTPGLGPSVSIGAPFFALGPVDRVKFLLRLMARSIPGEIPSSRINAYIEGADIIRTGRGAGP